MQPWKEHSPLQSLITVYLVRSNNKHYLLFNPSSVIYRWLTLNLRRALNWRNCLIVSIVKRPFVLWLHIIQGFDNNSLAVGRFSGDSFNNCKFINIQIFYNLISNRRTCLIKYLASSVLSSQYGDGNIFWVGWKNGSKPHNLNNSNNQSKLFKFQSTGKDFSLEMHTRINIWK